MSEGRERKTGSVRPRLLFGSLALAALSACTLEPASDHARQIRSSYVITFVFAAVIFVIVGGAIVYSAIRFRRKPGDDSLPPQIHGSRMAEIIWTVVPSIIVLILFIVSSTTLGKIDTAEASPMTIDVNGFQWQWKFAYPSYHQGNVTLTIQGTSGNPPKEPTLVLPLGQPVHFHLESTDVIHSFYIPVFLFKRDVIPGHPNDFTLTPDRAGTFAGKCAELCGLLHSEMLFNVQIVPKAQFDAWATKTLKFQVEHQSTCTPASKGKVAVIAKQVTFDVSCIQEPPNAPLTIEFDNQDQGIPHNIEIFTDSNATTRLGGATGPGDVVSGPGTTTYDIPGLPAGTYFFRCDVHPTAMTGQFKVSG